MYSVIILTKDEEINLPRCIKSLPDSCDVHVVDSGSNDKTREVATKLGAQVYTNLLPSPFLIADQRNWALENCTTVHSWILFLDADEELDEALRHEILVSIKSNEYDSYKLTPRYFFLGKWLRFTLGYPNWHDRLLNKDKVRIEGGVWEHFNSAANTGKIYTPYNHFANSKGLSDWLSRHDRYSSWDAQKVFDYVYLNKKIGTERKVYLRKVAAVFWPLRPFFRFLHMYVFRLGFLEGWRSLLFCLLYFCYELMIVVKIIEIKRKSKGKSI